MAQWQTKSSKTIHKTPWLKLVEDEVVRPDGKDGIYTYLDSKGTTGAIPVQDGKIYLVRDYHYPIKRSVLQFALGGLHDKYGTPLEAAKDELLEEMGITAQKWIGLPPMFTAPGLAHCNLHLFIATDLTFSEQKLEGTEITSKPVGYTIQEVKELIRNGDICTDLVIAGIFLAISYLEENGNIHPDTQLSV